MRTISIFGGDSYNGGIFNGYKVFAVMFSYYCHPEQRALASVVEGPSTNEKAKLSLYLFSYKVRTSFSHMPHHPTKKSNKSYGGKIKRKRRKGIEGRKEIGGGGGEGAFSFYHILVFLNYPGGSRGPREHIIFNT